ncbi:hypothetical protein GCM10009122_53680 [Fulvivirga kasyanovii]|uniref:DUF5908 family protein n=1 Tax=Fulvivirga TaxID=396811 RepID=UPI0012BB8A09|nr:MULTISPECIES: DUF5908 family protein [Fulvivirga]UII30610.1 DUF5908 family protein [Fulvivirga ulvae]
MAIEIKELIIRIKVNEAASQKKEIIREREIQHLSKKIIDECVERVLDKLNRVETSIER